MTTAGLHLTQAFSVARAQYPELSATWVRIAHRVSGRLPSSLLSVSLQRDGEVDLLVRSIEDEVAAQKEQTEGIGLFVPHYCAIMSSYWIGGVYETFRLLRERHLADEGEVFLAVLGDLELVRITLEKHEIAKDRTLKEPISLVRQPPKNDASDHYSYIPGDDKRSHIMPTGLSSSGSVMWQVIDLKNNTSRWIERRSLSDLIIDLWKTQ